MRIGLKPMLSVRVGVELDSNIFIILRDYLKILLVLYQW
jgi:hypothetical protein